MTVVVQQSSSIVSITEAEDSIVVVNQENNEIEVQASPPPPTLDFFGEGPQGAVGPGVSNGGNPGEILMKSSYSNYDTSWTATVDGGTFN